MRNQLTTLTSRIPEVVYAAEGKLDGHSVDLYAWSHSGLILSAGACSFKLSMAAASELVTHLQGALEIMAKTQASEAQGGAHE